jgi:hypothetical protein
MPAARLTASSSRVADAVLAILAGSNLADVAAVTGMNPDDIADAVQTYHAAGAIALEQRETARRHQIRARPGASGPRPARRRGRPQRSRRPCPSRQVAPARHSECAQKARTVGINQSLTDR